MRNTSATTPSGTARFALAIVAVALVGAACGSSDAASNGSGGGGESGRLAISGSSTVQPITSRVAEKFQQQNGDISISVDGPGTTDGFALFCKGETDINDASRPIDAEEEVPECEKNGVDFIELKIAIDGLTVMTNPANEDVACLDFKGLYSLLGPESKGFTNWSDANDLAEKVGSTTAPFPDLPLVVTGPGQESGTWGSFIDFVIKPIAEEQGLPEDQYVTRPDYQASANDNVILQGIEGSPSSLGWVGYAYYKEAGDQVKAIAVDSGESGCVEPTDSTIESKTYPLSRDLFFYVNATKLDSNDALKSFVDFYLSDEGLASVEEVGYLHEPDDILSTTQQIWDDQEVGTHEG
jgi:phosphate transport system substrate-binding protein